MDFHIQLRDGPARIGHLSYFNQRIITPNILFLHTPRWNAPEFADIIVTQESLNTAKPSILIGESIYSSTTNTSQNTPCLDQYLLYPKDVPVELHLQALSQNKNTNCCIIPGKKELITNLTAQNDADLFIIANATQLYSHQTSFVDFITTVRQQIGYGKLLYMPCVGDPTSIALLSYMGVDFFDSFSAIMAARNETFLFPTGAYKKTQMNENPCNCPVCISTQDTSSMKCEEILYHNYHQLLSEMKLVRNAIFAGSLRELVENRVRTRPHLAALLHILDVHHFNFLEERIPILRKQPMIATTQDALQRPEVRRFQQRVIQYYEKPESTKILLLLPCSAKKPYSFSKSHKLFRECLFSQANPFVVHEVIVTSPLGLVPRELELTYPASNYDIAVTGLWDENEKKMIRTQLKEFLQKNCYDVTIMHLSPVMQAFTSDLLSNPQVTCVDTPTSPASLAKLSGTLHDVTSHYDRVKTQTRMIENIIALACYQFGPTLAHQLMENCIVSGKYPYQKIMYNNTQQGMLTEERGLISLTLDGANRLDTKEHYWVEIADDFTLKGSVFAPGVIDADVAIRIGDEVLVKKKESLCGVGVALMNGDEMRELNHGEAVKIRHHV
jgi:archaeosine synthase